MKYQDNVSSSNFKFFAKALISRMFCVLGDDVQMNLTSDIASNEERSNIVSYCH